MARITRLSPEQRALLPLLIARYTERATATGACDRPRIEAAVDRLYRALDRRPPRAVRWFGSPHAGLSAARAAAEPGTGPSSRHPVIPGAPLWEAIDELQIKLANTALNGRLYGQLTGNHLAGPIDRRIQPVLRAIDGSMAAEAAPALAAARGLRPQSGQHNAPWIAFLAFCHMIGALSDSPALDALDDLCDAGWWWALEDLVILTERPQALHRDEQGRPHSDAGPAVAWPDGTSVWAWHGVQVPRDWIVDPTAITVEDIDGIANAELRRIAIERRGADWFLQTAGARVVGRDDWGTLWAREMLDREPWCVVEVLDATVRAEGVRRRYLLAVPPAFADEKQDRIVVERARVHGDGRLETARTPRGAIAWTFGLEADEYAPEVET